MVAKPILKGGSPKNGLTFHGRFGGQLSRVTLILWGQTFEGLTPFGGKCSQISQVNQKWEPPKFGEHGHKGQHLNAWCILAFFLLPFADLPKRRNRGDNPRRDHIQRRTRERAQEEKQQRKKVLNKRR